MISGCYGASDLWIFVSETLLVMVSLALLVASTREGDLDMVWLSEGNHMGPVLFV